MCGSGLLEWRVGGTGAGDEAGVEDPREGPGIPDRKGSGLPCRRLRTRGTTRSSSHAGAAWRMGWRGETSVGGNKRPVNDPMWSTREGGGDVGSFLFLAWTVGQVVLTEKGNSGREADLDILNLRLSGD